MHHVPSLDLKDNYSFNLLDQKYTAILRYAIQVGREEVYWKAKKISNLKISFFYLPLFSPPSLIWIMSLHIETCYKNDGKN